MRLKRLELCGFKSFLDKTLIHFKPGITAIVGPNGCGKSNLTDAVLWVLGEQRPKALRSETMEDVIFNGTEDRKPLGMAEVSLTVDDIRDPLPSPYSPYSEITFMRRLHRSGESEYFINQVPCRLKDIRDLLMDLKAGHRAIIEQGRIDDLLTASPLRRRELVEEVAGISKYRVRKEEATRKLAATEQNLLRIRDILSEVKRQINTLDRQAKAAEKYKRLYEELKAYDLYLGAAEWQTGQARKKALLQDEQGFRERLIEHETHAASLDLKISTLQLVLAEKEMLLATEKEQMARMTHQIGKAEGRIERVHAQKKEWQETQERIQDDLTTLQRTEAARTEELCLLEEEGQKATQEQSRIEEQFSQVNNEATQMSHTLSQKTDIIEKERIDVFDMATRLAAAHNSLFHHETRKTLLIQKREGDQIRIQEIGQKRGYASEQLQKLHKEGEGVERQWIEIRERHQLLLATLSALEIRQKDEEDILYKLRTTQALRNSDFSSREGFYRGQLGPMADTAFFSESSSLMADILEVPEEYEKAIEAVLGERLRGQIIEEFSHLREGIEKLQALKKGRGLLILRDLSPSKTKGSRGPQESENLSEATMGSAFSRVTCKVGYEAVVERLLNGFYLVRDTEAALSLGAQSPLNLVTLQGVLFENGVVCAGEREQDRSLLNQKREMAVLAKEVKQLQDQAEQRAIEIAQIKQQQQAIRTEISDVAQRIQEIETQRLALQKEIQISLIENEKLALASQALHQEHEDDTLEQDTLAKQIEEEGVAMAALKQFHEAREQQLSEWMGNQKGLQDGHQALKERCVTLQLTLTTLKEKGRHLFEKKDIARRSLESLAGSQTDKQMLLTLLKKKWTDAEREENEAQIEIETTHRDREQILNEIRKKTEEQTERSVALESLRAEARKTQSSKEQTRTDLNEKSVQCLEVTIAQEKIRETLVTQYQVDMTQTDVGVFSLPSPRIGSEGSPDSDYPDVSSVEAGEEERVAGSEIALKRDRLRASLNAMGPVHLGAIEEYQELTQRHQFLKDQEGDLVASMDDLKATISKIHQTTHRLFQTTFQALNTHWGETFSSFFGGGKAELVLDDPDHPAESGVSILAAPPGKKLRTLNLLSGGEKALTALSLLFAAFMTEAQTLFHDSRDGESEGATIVLSGAQGGAYPFCILDEVDAALDEENARRFAHALERFSERSQFVIVTHNKQTMQKAHLLYGVTAEHPGTSRVVSVSLREIDTNP